MIKAGGLCSNALCAFVRGLLGLGSAYVMRAGPAALYTLVLVLLVRPNQGHTILGDLKQGPSFPIPMTCHLPRLRMGRRLKRDGLLKPILLLLMMVDRLCFTLLQLVLPEGLRGVRTPHLNLLVLRLSLSLHLILP